MIEDYLTDAVTIIRAPARDEFGEPVGAPTEEAVKARVEFGMKLVRTSTGEQEISTATVTLMTAVTPGVDKLVFDGAEHSILAVTRARGLDEQFFKAFCA